MIYLTILDCFDKFIYFRNCLNLDFFYRACNKSNTAFKKLYTKTVLCNMILDRKRNKVEYHKHYLTFIMSEINTFDF